jgi:hypothetical protein
MRTLFRKSKRIYRCPLSGRIDPFKRICIHNGVGIWHDGMNFMEESPYDSIDFAYGTYAWNYRKSAVVESIGREITRRTGIIDKQIKAIKAELRRIS